MREEKFSFVFALNIRHYHRSSPIPFISCAKKKNALFVQEKPTFAKYFSAKRNFFALLQNLKLKVVSKMFGEAKVNFFFSLFLEK